MTNQLTQLTIDEKKFLVSVVVIAYNGRRYLNDCLASIIQQDFPAGQYEVVVVDNASHDGSADFIEQNYPGVRVLRFEHNYGPDEAFNRVLPHLHGKYIAYLNQDAVADRHWLAELVEVITTHPRAGLVESNMILSQWSEYNGRYQEAPIEWAHICDLTPYGVHDFHKVPVTPTTAPIPLLSAYCAGCIFNPQIIDKLGYFLDPEFFAYFDDIDLGLRLNAAGYEVLLAPRSVIYHDTDWYFKWDRRSVRRAFLSTRNMFLVFYKLCYPSEFLILLPRLLLGKILKATQTSRSLLGWIIYAVAALPLLLIGLSAAVLKMPGYYERRRLTMSRRIMQRGWLVHRLLNPGWQPDRTIWAGRPGLAEDHQPVAHPSLG
jgi:GT2 family glycosyltransferase